MSIKRFTSTIYVTDQERAKQFYTTVLGFDVLRDAQITPTFRFLSVTHNGGQEIALFSSDDAGSGVSPQTGQKMRELVEASAFSAGILFVDDCETYCDSLAEHGVVFISPPEIKPWGVIEALIRDDSGNRLAIASPHSPLSGEH